MDILKKLWVEKYNPKEIKHVLGNEQLISKIKKFLEEGDIPNLMFYGESGTGKTCISKILYNTLDCEYLRINGSDENGVDMVRMKIGTFVSSTSFKKIRLVVIDEFDYFSPSAQAILRNMIESSYKNARFVVTLNYPERIIPALHSRFQVEEVKPINIEKIEKRMIGILNAEKVEFEEQDVKDIVKNCYPDMRKMIQTLQQYSIDGVLQINSSSVISDSYKSSLINMLKKNEKFEKIREMVINSSTIDYVMVYKILFNSIDEYCKNKDNKSDMLLDIAEHLYRDASIVDKEINLSACILKLLKNNK